jgi:hypothetical protein
VGTDKSARALYLLRDYCRVARTLFFSAPPIDARGEQTDPFRILATNICIFSFSDAQTHRHSQQLRVMGFRRTKLWLRARLPGACRMDILVTTFTLSLSLPVQCQALLHQSDFNTLLFDLERIRRFVRKLLFKRITIANKTYLFT